MIQVGTMLNVVDNTGAKLAQCIRIPGASFRRYAYLGDVVTVAIKKAIPHTSVKKGDIAHGVVVRVRKEARRKNGTYIRFDDNAIVLINKETKEPKGNRIFGPVARELREKGYLKIIALAPEVY
ncbi:50S ribosomal protein L14 [bacterium]|nr:50S ribosomal protein L14 [bacterium]